MKTIWKYTLGVTDRQIVDVPTGFRVRHVGPNPTGKSVLGICVWIEVDPDAQKVPIQFCITGTGHPISPQGIYLGTAPMADALVWHVFLAVPL